MTTLSTRRRARAAAIAIGLAIGAIAACTTGDSTPTKMDAAGSGSGSGSGSGFGATCTTVSDTSTECMSGVCTNTFDMIPHPVCSQKCAGSADSASCPAGSDGVQKCNMKGYCKP